MKYSTGIILCTIGLVIMWHALCASVTVNTTAGTYTVDSYGSVEAPQIDITQFVPDEE